MKSVIILQLCLDRKQAMDATPFQNVNLSAHGKNCSDVLCVLPVCVNWKLRWLANSRNKPTQENKRNRLTSDAHSDRDEKLQRSEICKETASITNFSSSEDRNDETLKHLLEELEDFEEDFQIGKDDLRYSLPSLPDPQHGDPLLSSDSVISWNQLLNHQLPCDLMQVRETRKTSAQQLSNNVEAPSHKKRAALEVLPEKSAAMYSDIDFPTLDLEKFIPMDRYVRPTYNKQEPRKYRLAEQPNNTSKLFGVLSEILRLFELPMSRDVEIFYIEVLQRALAEIRRKRVLSLKH